MILTDQDSGLTIHIKLGEVVTVRLNENPTTGYSWMVETYGGLEKIDDYLEAVETGGAIGAGGVHVFQFRTTCSCSCELHIKNWREWEGESSVLARFFVNIIVK